MKVPIYFNLDKLEREYLIDFMDLKKNDPKLDFLTYLDSLSEIYFDIHSQMSVITHNEEILIESLEKYFNDKEFDDYIFTNFGFEIVDFQKSNQKIKEENLFGSFVRYKIFEIAFGIRLVTDDIYRFILNEILKLQITHTKKELQKIKTLSNPKKLALLQELGIFDLPIMQNLTDDKQNEIVALLLDADKTEFVYKNRLNINSKNPSYQTDKYTSYQHLESMKQLLDDMK
ncbi:hypothetical protein [Chryseobacterium mulctrae]|uniref:hypothetical protein n=1 Tax=Chryseobacterium mulctrae TaxID=2576777 RepID=UPI001115F642|nr:hypothetical protein [Chryseobacterium mulctrae]